MNPKYKVRIDERRLRFERLLALQPAIEAIAEKLPDDLGNVAVTDEGIQVSDATREQVVDILARLNAGWWEKRVCHADGGRVDYETRIDGARVLLFCSAPPTSCRIETEEVPVPAHIEIRRKLVCT